MPSCSAIGCSNTSSSYKDRKVTLHRFPVRDKELAELWVYNMNRDGFVPNKNSRLCSDHFLPECFEEDKYAKYGLSRGSRKRLTKEAVPTENFPYGPRNRPATTENKSPYPVSLFQIIHQPEQSLQYLSDEKTSLETEPNKSSDENTPVKAELNGRSSSERIDPDSLKTELDAPCNQEICKKEACEIICPLQPRHTRTSQDVVYFPEPLSPELQCTESQGESQLEDLGPSSGVPGAESETQQPETQTDSHSTKTNPLFSSPNTSLATSDDIFGIPQKIFVEKGAGEPPAEYVAAFVYLPDDKEPAKSKEVFTGVKKKGLIYLPRDTYDSIAESGLALQDSEEDSEYEPTEEEKLQHGSYSSKHDHPYCSSRSVSRSVQTKEVPVVPVKKGRKKKKRGRKRKLKTTETGLENNDLPEQRDIETKTAED